MRWMIAAVLLAVVCGCDGDDDGGATIDGGGGADAGGPDAATGPDAAPACETLGFEAAVGYTIGGGPTMVRGLAVGDVDGDDKPDLVVSEGGSGGILINNGDGTFAAEVTVPARSNAMGTPVDVILFHANVAVLLNKGDGTFENPVDYPVANFAASLAAADVNGDDHLDVVVVASGLRVLINNGDGTFAAEVTYPGVGGGCFLTAADLDGSGRPDVVADCAEISVFLDEGDGTFAPEVALSSSTTEPGRVVTADLDRDGHLDIVAPGPPMTIFPGVGDGSFGAALETPYSIVNGGGHAGVADDFDGDGWIDIAVVSNESTDGLLVFINSCTP